MKLRYTMQKIGLKIIETPYVQYKSIAQDIQRFIIEGNYSIVSIVKRLKNEELIILDVSNEEHMPELEVIVEEFADNDIVYQLYQEVDGEWEEVEIGDLDLDRNPPWLIFTVGVAVVGYFVFSFVEIFAIYDWYTIKYDIHGFFSAIAAGVTAFIPLVGSVIAYWSATELWHWDKLNTLILYFWYYLPLLAFIIYLVGMVLKLIFADRWYRFRYPEFN